MLHADSMNTFHTFWCLLCDLAYVARSSSKVEDITRAYTPQRPTWQSSTCAADAECQLSTALQQPCCISSPAEGAAVALSRGGKPAALPLVADATASSASQAADTAVQGGSSQQQHYSIARQSRDEQQSSSTHWAQEVIKVMHRLVSCGNAPVLRLPFVEFGGAEAAVQACTTRWTLMCFSIGCPESLE